MRVFNSEPTDVGHTQAFKLENQHFSILSTIILNLGYTIPPHAPMPHMPWSHWKMAVPDAAQQQHRSALSASWGYNTSTVHPSALTRRMKESYTPSLSAIVLKSCGHYERTTEHLRDDQCTFKVHQSNRHLHKAWSPPHQATSANPETLTY